MSSAFSSDPGKGTSLMAIKTAQKAKEDDEKQRSKRRRGALVLMLQFLQESGYSRSLEALQAESGVSLSKVCPADNMDLMSVLTQFEEQYDFKFGRRPKFFRNVDGSGDASSAPGLDFSGGMGMMTKPKASASAASAPSAQQGGGARPSAANHKEPRAITGGGGGGKRMDGLPPLQPISGNGEKAGDGKAGIPQPPNNDNNSFGLAGRAVKFRRENSNTPTAEDDAMPAFQGRSNLKPMPIYPTNDLNDLAATIHRDILDHDPNVGFADIAELDDAKQLLKEACVMPSKYPQLFQGIVRPWKGILLFGPPGTGKTMLAKAVATECRTTFFNISASSIVSKWRGEGEKLVRMLFELAVHFAPSTIFIDELDSIMGARNSDEHEATRRMKTEFLLQMDGLAKRQNGDIVFVLAASNLPWDLDSAVLRRLEKRILVGLPSENARAHMFQKYLPSVVPNFDHRLPAQKTDGFSGADVDICCREATMRTVRVLIEKLEAEKGLTNTAMERPQVSMEDVLESIDATRASGSSVPLKKYTAWMKHFGSTMSRRRGEAGDDEEEDGDDGDDEFAVNRKPKK